MTPDSTLCDEFIQARHLRIAAREEIQFVTIHDTESPLGSPARNIALWWNGAASPETSAHYVVGDDGILQCVREHDEAWSAGPTGNRLGIHVEVVSKRSDGEVAFEQHPDTVMSAAHLIADIADRWGLPRVFVDAAGLVAGRRGITTHEEVSKAYKQTTHIDPSPFLAVELVTRAALL